jgi:hypothetical protein
MSLIPKDDDTTADRGNMVRGMFKNEIENRDSLFPMVFALIVAAIILGGLVVWALLLNNVN